MKTIHCGRCGEQKPALEKAPFRNERGQRIQARVCVDCWDAWLKHQTLLINHYGLDPREQKSRDFLYSQIDEVLLGDGQAEQVDTTKQGSIEW